MRPPQDQGTQTSGASERGIRFTGKTSAAFQNEQTEWHTHTCKRKQKRRNSALIHSPSSVKTHRTVLNLYIGFTSDFLNAAQSAPFEGKAVLSVDSLSVEIKHAH